MTDLLSVGASGLRAYQTALNTTSDNIANASTPGYARRSVTLAEVVSTNGLLAQQRATTGNGVTITGIARAVDPLRAAAVRNANADLSRTQSSITYLNGIQGALTGSRLTDQITAFFNTAQAVAADPSSSAPRAQLIESAKGVATAFATTGRALDQADADLDSTAQSDVAQINSLSTALAKVNDGLGRASQGSVSQAQLLDQRDQLIDQLSQLADVSVATDAAGRATVSIGGPTGAVLVSGTEGGNVTYARSASGAVAFAINRAGTTSALSPTGGALAGIIEGAARIADTRTQVEQIATDFVDGVNQVQAQGRDLDGNPGQPLFAQGATPTDISVPLTSLRGVAAAAVGEGPRGNGNLDALQALRTSGGFESNLTGLIADNGATLQGRQTVSDAQTAIQDSAVSARDQVSGVNLDAEAVDLLRFQQAYQASSRVIQIARDTLQTLLDIR